MVRVLAPPPLRPPVPLFHTLPAGTSLCRLFDPTGYGATATSCRFFGPLLRFDHQRGASGKPAADTERGVYYAGFTLSCCIVEVFGDTGFVECDDWRVALPRLIRDVRLLDLRDSGAMRAGSVAALGKIPDVSVTQAWSRHFYESPVYAAADGLLWYNAHNDEDAIVFYERAADALDCPPEREMRLDDPDLRPVLTEIAERNHLILVP